MTNKQIEALVESVENRMVDELGEYTRIEIMGYESGDYDVQFQWDAHGVEHSEIVANDLTDDELYHFLQNDVDSWLREFYYRMKNGRTLWDKAHVTLAEWITTEGGDKLVPGDVYVDIRWKEDGDIAENVCICCSETVCDEQASGDFDSDEPLCNGNYDSGYFFYCNGIKEFFKLCERDNGEDFEIIEVHGWD